ncbi:TetR/AcrR family transcriptional regulator [Arsenicicoccus sp. oral taxon 190]|uniref:TetR/AcrR family transcriptional regulator n=1 Tax=Arsenicicoccus sp. oral taxon 190 TaxID=1658671 RepID=UPI00067A325A|nr:TetR/AcrR family transcriptional regulator [Arsenicicoccus sp. oral taxon 190]AKT51019.1 hypothetical protein ADJ73_06285 [Arsenicicoccus sp. oral taxon 190]
MPTTPRRASYHHGDLKATLLREAIDVAQAEGPHAVTLRTITRRVGVSVNAPYRHFADREALMLAVAAHGQQQSAAAMERRLDALASPSGHDRLRAVGLGYVDFARAEPGLFQAAFLEPTDLRLSADAATAGPGGRTPYQLLGDALDQMVTDGELPAERRPHAEVPAWSAVHGFAMLVVQGPLRGLPAEAVDPLAERVVESVITGLVRV